jgi:hypothetical protein
MHRPSSPTSTTKKVPPPPPHLKLKTPHQTTHHETPHSILRPHSQALSPQTIHPPIPPFTQSSPYFHPCRRNRRTDHGFWTTAYGSYPQRVACGCARGEEKEAGGVVKERKGFEGCGGGEGGGECGDEEVLEGGVGSGG